MKRTWKLLAPKVSYVEGQWIASVRAKSPTTRPIPVLNCSCRNRCHCHSHHMTDMANWRTETVEQQGHGFSKNLLEAIEQAYVDLSEKIK